MMFDLCAAALQLTSYEEANITRSHFTNNVGGSVKGAVLMSGACASDRVTPIYGTNLDGM